MADKRLIPPGIRDANTEALNELIDRYGNIDLVSVLVNIIDLVDASALPHLAEQFHITGDEGWLLASNEIEQRDLIKNAIILHKHKGTKYAIERVCEVLNLRGEVSEWFEYGGEPYYFKVDISLTKRRISSELVQVLIRMVNEFKNVRSWLEEIIVAYLIQGRMCCVGGTMAEGQAFAAPDFSCSGNMIFSGGAMGECAAFASGGES